MQTCFRSLVFMVITIGSYYPQFALSANRVVVIPLEADRPNLSNIVTVAKRGGDYTNIIQAVRSISDASSNNPYVVYVAPGAYTTTEAIFLPPYVSLIGSGVTSTIINSDFNRPTAPSFSRLAGIAAGFHNEVANLTLNRTSDDSAVGLYTENTIQDQFDTNVHYSNLVINMSATLESRAVVNDINGFGARLKIEDTQINMSGETLFAAGIQNIGSGGLRLVDRVNMTLEGASTVSGISNSEGVVRLNLFNSNINITTVSNSSITGVLSRSGNNIDIRNTKILVGGGQISSIGVLNRGTAFSRIENSQIRSFLTVEGQLSNGVDNRDNTASARIVNSTISGDTRPLAARNGSGIRETYVSFSVLGGDGITSGSPVCRFNVDENNVALTSNCREP